MRILGGVELQSRFGYPYLCHWGAQMDIDAYQSSIKDLIALVTDAENKNSKRKPMENRKAGRKHPEIGAKIEFIRK